MKNFMNEGRVCCCVILMTAALALAMSAMPARASVDTTPAPGGIYRLKPGAYVNQDVSCESAHNGAIRKYNGRSISTTDQLSCQVSVLSRRGNRYTVDQSCLDTRMQPGRRRVERQRIVVSDALTFTQTLADKSATYRYCPAYQLPRR